MAGFVSCQRRYRANFLVVGQHALDQHNAGEEIQCRSLIASLTAMGYGVVVVHGHKDANEMLYYHNLFEDLVKAMSESDYSKTRWYDSPR